MDPRELGTHRSLAQQAIAEVFVALGVLTRAIGNLVCALTGGHFPPSPSLQLKETRFMYIVKDTQPDVAYALSFKVTDAEGQVIAEPQGLTVELVSDNPAAVTLTPDPADSRKGMAHFESPNPDGTPAVANLVATVKLADGTVVGTFGDQIAVTTGDPAAISGGTLSLEGLLPAPAEGGPALMAGAAARKARSVST